MAYTAVDVVESTVCGLGPGAPCLVPALAVAVWVQVPKAVPPLSVQCCPAVGLPWLCGFYWASMFSVGQDDSAIRAGKTLSGSSERMPHWQPIVRQRYEVALKCRRAA